MKLPEGSPSFGRTHVLRLPSESARGEASRRKPVLREDAARGEASRRTFRKPKVALFSKQVRFLRKAPEVKLSEGSRRKPKEAEGSRRKPKEAEGRAFFKTSSLPSESASSRRKGVLRFLRKAGEGTRFFQKADSLSLVSSRRPSFRSTLNGDLVSPSISMKKHSEW